jgi:hypothetical protein
MARSVPEVLYRLTWQVAGYPENTIFGKHQSVTLVRDLLKDRGVNKIELRVMEATSARLPAPDAESIQSVDHGAGVRQTRRHETSRTVQPDRWSSGNGTEFS